MPITLNPPPPTPVESVTETLHGVPVTDPYRWLEDQNSPRTRKWLEEQVAYTRAYLDALPSREQISKRVEELLAVKVISEPWKIGNRYFYLKRTPQSQQSVIMMRDGETGGEIALVDPVARDAAGRIAARLSSSMCATRSTCPMAYRGDFVAAWCSRQTAKVSTTRTRWRTLPTARIGPFSIMRS